MIQRQGNRGTGRKAALQDGNYAAVDGFTRLCFLAACLGQSSCFSPPISEKVEQAVCPPGIRAERIRADTGFEAASPFPAAGGISLPCLRLPPPRVSGQGGSVPAIPCTPPESSFLSPWALGPICLTNLTFCKKVQGSMPGRSCFPPCIISLDVV